MDWLKLIELAGVHQLTKPARKAFHEGNKEEVEGIVKTAVATTVTGVVLITVAPALGLLTIPMAFGFANHYSKGKQAISEEQSVNLKKAVSPSNLRSLKEDSYKSCPNSSCLAPIPHSRERVLYCPICHMPLR